MPKPECPPELRKLRMDGQIVLHYIIGTDGRAEFKSIRVHSTNHASLVEPAVRLVRLAKFEPAQRAGAAVRMQSEHRITFYYQGS